MYVSAGQIIVLLVVGCLLPSRRQSPAPASIQGDAPAQCHFPLLGMCRVRRVCKRCLLIILFDTDGMDWIAAAEATLGTQTKKERKRERLLRTDTSREELPSPAHQKQKTVSRKKRQEKSRYRQRLLPESPGCQYTVREKLVFK